MELNFNELYSMTKTAGYGLCPSCGANMAPGSSRERSPHGSTTCGACGGKTKSALWKEADDNDPQEPKPTIGRQIIDRAKTVGSAVIGAGGAVVEGVKALSIPAPIKEIPRN